MDRIEDLVDNLKRWGSMLEGIIMSFLTTTLYVIEILGLILSPMLAVAPYVILVVGVVWGVWLLSYFFTDLFMEVLYLWIQFETMLINMYIFVYNTMAPILLPPIYSVWNKIMKIILGWFLDEASVFCPCIGTTCSFPPPLSDLSQDCAPLMKAFGTVKDIFTTAVDILSVTIQAISAALGNLRTTMCTSGSGYSNSHGCSLLGKYHHLSAADETTSRASATAAFSQAISLVINIIAAVVIDIILPVMMLFTAFWVDICIIQMKLFAILIIDLGGIFVNMLKNVIVMLGGNSSPDSFTAQSFLQGIGSVPPFLHKTPGPAFLKNILLIIEQAYGDIVNAVFNIVYSFMLLVDKGMCTLLNPIPCIIGDALRVAAQVVQQWNGPGSNLIAGALYSAANSLGFCICDSCPIQSSVIASHFISYSGCNPAVQDPNVNVVCAPNNQPCACCPIPSSIPSLIRLLFGGENHPHIGTLYSARNNNGTSSS
jgi:hypothetical protein